MQRLPWLLIALVGCTPTTVPVDEIPPVTLPTPSSTGRPWFVTGATLDFGYRNGEEANHYTILESLGGGVALFDYDRDGNLDIFVIGGGTFGAGTPFTVEGLPNRLYRNLGNWKFEDVTHAVGLDQPVFYGHGVAVADYDADGWPDLLITGYGRVVLYHNEPTATGRKFVDVTALSQLVQPIWATSAAWGDLDGDGLPDLFIGEYVKWSPQLHRPCPGKTPGSVDVCPPQAYEPLISRVYRNRGDGTFEDRTLTSQFRRDGKTLGVVMLDFDEDGRTDIYVANDAMDNFLYLNRGNWKFDEVGRLAGVALDDQGQYDGSMGVAVADVTGDGRPSILTTNFQDEYHALYRNLGSGRFQYASQAFGIAALGQKFVGFGTSFTDFDMDGIEDLVIANGHVLRHPRGSTYTQLPVLMRGANANGRRRFERVDSGGDYFTQLHSGRGLAVGDLDGDGRPDLVISHQNAPLSVLKNNSTVFGTNLRVESSKNHDVVGTRLRSVDGSQTRWIAGGASYLSVSEKTLFLPGKDHKWIIQWPDGQKSDSVVLSSGSWVWKQGEPAPQRSDY